VQFGLANNQPHGCVFVNRNRGLIFVGARLPRWQRTKRSNGGLFPRVRRPNPPESSSPMRPAISVNVRTTPIDTARIHVVAVSATLIIPYVLPQQRMLPKW
jgi:hypothetical protein